MPKSARPKTSLKTKHTAVNKRKKPIGKKLVEKKPYVELVTALLTIPFLITVLILNTNTLTKLNATPTPTPEAPLFRNGSGFMAAPVGPDKPTPASADLTLTPCTKGLGPISIPYPGENDTITQNPITITINYDDSKHCGAVWSYRINGGSWSGYDDRSVALYNLPHGQVTFDLRVKSIVTSEEKQITRKFIYKGEGVVFPPDNASGSGSTN